MKNKYNPHTITIDDVIFACQKIITKHVNYALKSHDSETADLKSFFESRGFKDVEAVDMGDWVQVDCFDNVIIKIQPDVTCEFIAGIHFEYLKDSDESKRPVLYFGVCVFKTQNDLYDVNFAYAKYKTMKEFVDYALTNISDRS